ncbi:MAG TPA: CoA pyrophosphatase [Gammaproteobacteria bacterium]|nr:CoA pyrophosphatase [Gammaproteobacteria bacterium]
MPGPLRAPSLAAIRRIVAAPRAAVDPLERIVANVEGGRLSPALRAVLDQPTRLASVLLALLERRGGLTVLFTERAAHLKDHAGQISFPGGRIAEQGETAVAAALREAQEEIGLDPAEVEILGPLDDFLTGTGFLITPIVGYVASGEFVAVPDPTEVASVFEVPLDFICEPASIVETYRERLGTRFRTYELEHGGYRIWGATAAILVSFRDLISQV